MERNVLLIKTPTHFHTRNTENLCFSILKLTR